VHIKQAQSPTKHQHQAITRVFWNKKYAKTGKWYLFLLGNANELARLEDAREVLFMYRADAVLLQRPYVPRGTSPACR
jgi:hypothetical protein